MRGNDLRDYLVRLARWRMAIRRKPWPKALKVALRAVLPKPRPVEISAEAPPFAPPLLVAGLFRGANGLGQSARMCFRALQDLGYDPVPLDVTDVFSQEVLPPPGPAPDLSSTSSGTIIVHLNAPDLPLALSCLGERLIRGRRVIGYWHWELPRAPDDWSRYLSHVHEIWVPSRFVAEAVRPVANVPVKVVPHPVPSPEPSTRRRSDFGIPDDAFLVVSVFNFDSGFDRKNPLASVDAFQRAFGGDPRYQLLIKVRRIAPFRHMEKALDEAVRDVPNVRIVSDTLSTPDLGALIACSDVVISLHRSEGFGLVPAEAMLLGKPVIATAWSANAEFMTERNAALVGYRLVPVEDRFRTYSESDQCWAEPDVDEATRWLRRLAEDPQLRQSIGKQAAIDARETFTVASYAEAIGIEPRSLSKSQT